MQSDPTADVPDLYGRGVIAVIRALYFVGGTHYCPECMNEFHASRGQHKPDCAYLAALMENDEWWEAIAEGPS